MRLFEKEPLRLFRKYHGYNIADLSQTQIKSIDWVFRRFISLSKRIETKLKYTNSFFELPEQYITTEYCTHLNSSWSFKIFPTQEAKERQLGYSLSLSQKLYISCNFNNSDLGYLIPGCHYTFHINYITQKLNTIDFVNKLVKIIELHNLMVRENTAKGDNLEFLKSCLFSSLTIEREIELSLMHLKDQVQMMDEVSFKYLDLLFLIKELINVETREDAISEIEDFFSNYELPGAILYTNEQDESSDFYEKVQRGKRKNLQPGPQSRSKPRMINGKRQWGRDLDCTYTALHNSSFTCEFDSLHKTFISGSTGNFFMEGHHLIPMFTQNNFQFSLDVPENIISLCPICHKQIHYGTKEDKFRMVEYFFNSRLTAIRSRGIIVELSRTMKFYDIPSSLLKLN